MLNIQDILGQYTVTLMTILLILVKYLIFEANINAHINLIHGYPYSTTKGIMITWINKDSWQMLRSPTRGFESKEIPQNNSMHSM